MFDPNSADFDPAADFVAMRNFRYAGQAITRGGNIDKEMVPDATRYRELKRLYDNHFITVRPEGAEEVETGVILPIEITPELQERIDALMSTLDRTALNGKAMTLGIEKPNQMGNKIDVATAIVRAEAASAPKGR